MPMKKYGRRPARHTLRTMRSAIAMDRSLSSLGSPPAVSDDYVTPLVKALSALSMPGGGGGPFGMFLNDALGDCVCADSAHQVMLHTACAGTIVVPTDDEVLKLYSAVGGYIPGNAATDTGCDETSMCEYMITTGLAGEKASRSGSIDPANLDNVRWAVQLFGACRLGIVVDQNMETEFDAQQPWATAASKADPTAGGHDVPIVKYDARFAYVITWGALQAITWELLAESSFLEEAHAEVWPDFITAAGNAPNGFDLQQLLTDLPSISPGESLSLRA